MGTSDLFGRWDDKDRLLGLEGPGGRVVQLGNVRRDVAVIVGDSLVDKGSNAGNGRRNTMSIVQHAMRKLGRPLHIANEQGYSGKRTDEIFASFDADVAAYRPGWVFWLSGNNDIFQAGTAQQTYDRLMLVRDRCAEIGAQMMFLGLAPSTGSVGAQVIRMMQERARSDGVLHVCAGPSRLLDYSGTAASIAAGTPFANMLTDGNTHPTARGAVLWGDSLVDYLTAMGLPGVARWTSFGLGNPGGNSPTSGDVAANMLQNGYVGAGGTYGQGWSSSVTPAAARVATPTTQPMGTAGLQASLPGRLQRVVFAPGTTPAVTDQMNITSLWDLAAGASAYAGKTWRPRAYIKASAAGGKLQGLQLTATVYRWDYGQTWGAVDNQLFDPGTMSAWGMNVDAYEGVFEAEPFALPATWASPDQLHIVLEVRAWADPGATVTIDVGAAEIARVFTAAELGA